MRNPPIGAPKAPAWPRRKTFFSASSAFGAPFAVPLAVLVWVVPFTFASFVGPAGADTASDCESAFSSAPAAELAYTTDPVERLAWTGQTVRLSAGWDPSAWDGLTSAVACVRLDDTFDDALGTSDAAPDNGGTFDHSFTIPEVAQGTRLCTRIRLTGDPAGEPTEAVWVSKMHCFEVDHDVPEDTPSEDTTPPPTTSTTVPTAAPPGASSTPGSDTPAVDSPQSPAPMAPEGGGGPVGTPFDSAGETPSPGAALPPSGTTPEYMPLLPATGYASMSLLHTGELCLFTGLALLVLGGLPRRRRAQMSRVTSGLS